MRVHNLTIFLTIFCFLFLFTSCNKDDESPMEMMEEEMEPDNEEPDSETFAVESIQGLSQKGPYLIGSTVTIFELEDDLTPTGRSFTEDITNNLGSFEISNLTLASSFVELRASGFYFNEVTGETSEAQINLSALVDLTDQSSINVNLLTTLEKNRVEFLIEQGMSFGDAKAQALIEVLREFEVTESADASAEQLNITQAGNGNAILLAVSAIIQGNNSVGEVSELISKISLGLETDGLFEDDVVCSQLSSAASLISPMNIRTNLEEWYDAANTSISIPAFEPFITDYIQNTPCQAESGIIYPASGFHGLNLLAEENINFDVNESYSMHAILDEGTSLKIRVIGNNWSFNPSQGDSGWIVGDLEGTAVNENRNRLYTSSRTGSLDFKLNMTQPIGNALQSEVIKFEVFENGASIPTRVISITIQGITLRPIGPSTFEFIPSDGRDANFLRGIFIAQQATVFTLEEEYKHGFAVNLPDNFDLEILVSGENFTFPANGVNEGWTIEQINVADNSWRLTASGLGYYEAELELLFSQGCVKIDTEIILNGSPFTSFSLNSNQDFIFFSPQRDGQYGPNILNKSNTIAAGEVSLAAELFPGDFDNITVVLNGSGWSIPTPIENINWIIEDYDAATQSQTFVASEGNGYYLFENDLKLLIENFAPSNPPDIFVEIISDLPGCGPTIIESFNVRF